MGSGFIGRPKIEGTLGREYRPVPAEEKVQHPLQAKDENQTRGKGDKGSDGFAIVRANEHSGRQHKQR